MSPRIIRLVLLCLLLSATADVSRAGEPSKPAEWSTAGSLRTRLEVWDWFETGSPAAGRENDYSFVGNLLRVSAKKSGPESDYVFELAMPSLLGLPDDAIAPGAQGQLGLGGTYRAANGGQRMSAFLKQGYLTMKGREGRSLRVGRFEFVDGLESLTGDATLDWLKKERIGHRLLGTFGFTHVGRSFDGAHLTIDRPDKLFSFVAARPTQGVFDLDGMDGLDDIGVQYAAMTFRDPEKQRDSRLFALHYTDGRGLLKTDSRALALRTLDRDPVDILSLGGHHLRKVGDVDLTFWGVYQTGDWGRLDHEAWAWNAEAGYRFGTPRDPWLRAGISVSSGDPDPADGRHESFFQVLPTPRIYARFPFYNMMNLRDVFAALIVQPSSRSTLRTEFHVLSLAEASDLWYQGGGAFQRRTFGYVGRPSGGADGLASVIDLALDYRFDSDTSVTLYGAKLFGGDAVRATYPADDSATYGFVEVTRKF